MVLNGFKWFLVLYLSKIFLGTFNYNTTMKVMSISNVGGVTHSRNLSRLYLHKQSLETPTHVLKFILLLAI